MSTSPAIDVAPAASACPKCEKPLTDPYGLGWCQSCGYCRSLGDVCVPVEKPGGRPDPMGQPTATPPSSARVWIVVTAVGVLVIGMATWVTALVITLSPLHRATWCTVQIVSGVFVMLAGQGLALIRIAPEEATLHAFDGLVPFRLYGLVFKRMPQFGWVMYFAAWGLTLIVAALACVGGLEHWLTYLPKAR